MIPVGKIPHEAHCWKVWKDRLSGEQRWRPVLRQCWKHFSQRLECSHRYKPYWNIPVLQRRWAFYFTEHSCVAEKVSILFHRNQDSVLNVTMLFLDTDVTFMTRMANHNNLKIRWYWLLKRVSFIWVLVTQSWKRSSRSKFMLLDHNLWLDNQTQILRFYKISAQGYHYFNLEIFVKVGIICMVVMMIITMIMMVVMNMNYQCCFFANHTIWHLCEVMALSHWPGD